MSEPTSDFEEFGGTAFFESLVSSFYARVAHDPVLRPMYPEEDLRGAARRLTLFLEQYWGGPTTYSEERGHPRLRMRHAPYLIDADARDRWLAHMQAAVADQEMDPAAQQRLWHYFVSAAYGMQNVLDDAPAVPAIDVTEVER
jgi:hemoglobin